MLDTGVVAGRALLPGPPAYWSYSSLREVKGCPLRYALARASYPDLWSGRGYPPLPTVHSLFGNVVHDALEGVIEALNSARVESPQSVEATGVLRSLGGLTTVIEHAMTKQLDPLGDNPRLDDHRRRRIARDLLARTSDARVQVQIYLSRTTLSPNAPVDRGASQGGAGISSARGRAKLRDGTHTEVSLLADDLRLLGRVDFLTIAGEQVEIVDYKTGAQAPAHEAQLWLYALLWDADRQSNPERLGLSNLTVAYVDRDVNVAVPSRDDLQELASALAADIATGDAELEFGSPTPLPDPEQCPRCTVRQLCTTYWQKMVPTLPELVVGEWFDYEGIIGEQNGQRSWWVTSPPSRRPELLLRTTNTTPPFTEGDRIRFLNLRLDSDPNVSSPLASMTVATEVIKVELR